MKVADKDADEVIAYLHERELVNRVYVAKWLPVVLPTGGVRAYAFVAGRGHEKFVSRLSEAAIVKLILQGRGKMGTCLDYVQNLVHHLDELGIADGPLHRLVRQAEEAEVLALSAFRITARFAVIAAFLVDQAGLAAFRALPEGNGA